jgi:hypothetical protein
VKIDPDNKILSFLDFMAGILAYGYNTFNLVDDKAIEAVFLIIADISP